MRHHARQRRGGRLEEREKGGAARVNRRTNAQEGRGGGAGRGGTGGDSGWRGHGRERGAELGVEDAFDRWAPPVGDHVRERERALVQVGRVGRKRGWAAR
jgi:hypothetical protein